MLHFLTVSVRPGLWSHLHSGNVKRGLSITENPKADHFLPSFATLSQLNVVRNLLSWVDKNSNSNGYDY